MGWVGRVLEDHRAMGWLGWKGPKRSQSHEMVGLEGSLKMIEPWDRLEGSLKVLETQDGLEGSLKLTELWDGWVGRVLKAHRAVE